MKTLDPDSHPAAKKLRMIINACESVFAPGEGYIIIAVVPNSQGGADVAHLSNICVEDIEEVLEGVIENNQEGQVFPLTYDGLH